MNRGYATKKQVAEYLGMSVRTVERLMGSGPNDLPFCKINKTVRFKWKAVEDFMERHSVRQIVNNGMEFMGK